MNSKFRFKRVNIGMNQMSALLYIKCGGSHFDVFVNSISNKFTVHFSIHFSNWLTNFWAVSINLVKDQNING